MRANNTQDKTIIELFDPLFKGFNEKSGAQVLEELSDRFQAAPSSSKVLAVKIDELKAAIGRLESYHLIGVQQIIDVDRYQQVAFLTLHKDAPALWEATIYKKQGEWTILWLKFSTDELFDKAGRYSAQ